MNLKYYWTIAIFFISFSTQLYSQDSLEIKANTDFLRDYIPPNYNFQLLSLSPSFRESISRSDNLDRDRFAASLFGYYRFLSQKDKSDTDLDITVRSNFISDEKNDVKTDNDNYFEFKVSSDADKYFYLSGKAFVSVGYDLESSNRILYRTENFNSNFQELKIPISIGFGRPFRVNDAWSAMTLFNDLECYGIASDRTRYKEVADVISVQRNTRFMDRRLGRIQNRTKLIEYLDNNDIVDFTPLSSAVLHDNFNFENFRTRFSGFRINGGVIPRLATRSTGDGTTTSTTENFFELDPFINFQYFLPIAEDWQFDIYSFTTYESTVFVEDFNAIKSVNIFTLTWLPNARTNASTEFRFDSYNNEVSVKTNAISLGFNLSYYVSPAIRWNTQIYFSNNWQEISNVKSSSFTQVFSGGLTYLIF